MDEKKPMFVLLYKIHALLNSMAYFIVCVIYIVF